MQLIYLLILFYLKIHNSSTCTNTKRLKATMDALKELFLKHRRNGVQPVWKSQCTGLSKSTKSIICRELPGLPSYRKISKEGERHKSEDFTWPRIKSKE